MAATAARRRPALVNRSFGIAMTSTQPIIAERAMYLPGPRIFEGGHESAGVNDTNTQFGRRDIRRRRAGAELSTNRRGKGDVLELWHGGHSLAARTAKRLPPP